MDKCEDCVMFNKFNPQKLGIDKRYVFLIGNGINIAMGNKDSWNDLLYSIADCKQKSLLFANGRIPKLTPTETLNAIQFTRKDPHDNFIGEVAKKIKKIVFAKRKESSLLDYIKREEINVLTTNFDLNIEKYIDKSVSCDIKSGNKHYNFEGRKISNLHIWHLHGSIDKYRTILFSMTRYMRAAKKIVDELNNNKSGNISVDFKKTWIWQLLSRPLVIAGLALSPCELLLRWLLIEKAMNAKKVYGIEQELPQSYYLHRKNECPDELSTFLKLVNIQPICMGDDVFNNDVWKEAIN